uniref:Tyrosine-protein kinase n=2 Tax=Ascaris TaxID=6251 RepID=F1L6T8_ASCSU
MTAEETDATAEEYVLQYFHGALPDVDADKLLVHQGDFLIQSRHDANNSRDRLILAIRKGSRVRRFDIQRCVHGVRILGKSFASIQAMVEHYHSKNLETARGELLRLRHAIPKGRHYLSHHDIKLIQKIGSGAYGTVYRGLLIKDNRAIAVKRIGSDGEIEKGLKRMMKEARVMQLYEHPNIVKFYGFVIDRPPYLLAMELCTGGSVEDKLRHSGQNITIARRIDMCCQASRGLSYLHQKSCIHRDIATRNCLLAGAVLKLADFGMCRPKPVYKIDLSKPQNIRWLAPEVWHTGETCFATDIYAFGIMLWEFFEIPYNIPYSNWKAITVKERVMCGYRMPAPKSMPPLLSALMRKCCDQQPDARPTAIELRRHLERINEIPIILIYKMRDL